MFDFEELEFSSCILLAGNDPSSVSAVWFIAGISALVGYPLQVLKRRRLKRIQILVAQVFGNAWEGPVGGPALFLRLPAVNSSDGRESGSTGLFPRRFFSYLFRRLWVSWKKIVKEASLCSLLAFEQICLCRSGYHGFSADRGVDPAGNASGGG
ncbi:hypothetical protein F511_32177 [Dorcoceras hygrometricum]|uniref:Uncharacterized protein n=1 Tax=Dorcoceras hygrometricum TaxID=472368 RepID=A0A2Z7AAK1_9LAMI|nr:hypothetical protein F511_32177 [Dorcoceras hygrometricum]